MEEVRKGTIVFIQEKRFFGFVRDNITQKDTFFHGTGVCTGKFDDLRCGMEVEYMRIETQKGPAAIGVVVL